MNLDAVMQEVAEDLDTIPGLRVHGYPADSVTPPAAVLSYPEVTYDETMRRGMDRYSMPLFILVGKVSDRAARKTIAPYLDGSGPKSVKTVLESATHTAFHSVRVQRAEPDVVRIANVDYLAYQFTLDIAGQGAP